MEEFYSNGLRFECTRCSGCCGKTPGVVYLSKRDLMELCKFFDMTAQAFVEKYCKWENYYYGQIVLALQSKKNNDCILWDNGCSSYDARPVQCSTYPFWTWMVKDKSMWEECAQDCPGMNKGRLWSKEEIEECMKSYDDNVPLTKEEFDDSTFV